MTTSQISANIFAYFIFTMAPIIAWPGRYNVAWTTQVAFFITAYLIPIFLLDFSLISEPSTLDTLTTLNAAGAAALVAGILIGKKYASKRNFYIYFFPDTKFVSEKSTTERRVTSLLIIGTIGMLLCFAWMGMLPAFAEDPFSAKFFKGAYKEKYDQIAIAYRFSQFAVITVLPLAMAFGLEKKNTLTVGTCILAMGTLAASLTRAPVLEGAMLIAAIKLAKTRKSFFAYILVSVLIYIIGSAIYAILGLTQSEESFLEEAAAGAPDIIDHLSFLRQFDISKDLTYGLTFIGGLVPGNFEYNPAIYSLTISNPLGDPTESASGGFRMPPSLWGYAAYGFIGSPIVCFLSGFIIGNSIKLFKRLEKTTSLVEQVTIAIWFKLVITFYSMFYSMFYFGLLSLAIFIFVTHKKARTRRKSHQAPQQVAHTI